jgi:hypothetical protein
LTYKAFQAPNLDSLATGTQGWYAWGWKLTSFAG